MANRVSSSTVPATEVLVCQVDAHRKSPEEYLRVSIVESSDKIVWLFRALYKIFFLGQNVFSRDYDTHNISAWFGENQSSKIM
jgi:hypothetical protein